MGRFRTMTRLAAGVAAGLAAAAAAPDCLRAQDDGLQFSYTQSQSEETPQSASGAAGSISFTGSLATGTPCYELTAARRTEGSRVTLTVTATATEGACIQVVTFNNYQGTVSGLAPGDYTFEVVHRTGGGEGETVYTAQVTVT